MNEPALFVQVSTVFDALWQELVCEGGGGTIPVHTTRGIPGGRIALTSRYELGEVKFNDMIKNLYQQEVDEEELIASWDKAVEVLLNKARNPSLALRRVFKEVLPDFEFSWDEHPYFACVQFLKVVSFSDGYRLKNGAATCLLQTPSGLSIGIDRLALVSSKGATRTKRRVPNLLEPLRLWRGRYVNRPNNALTSGAYLLLQKGLPRRGEMIDALFAIALEGGMSIEEAIFLKVDAFFSSSSKDQYANKYEGDTLEAFNIIISASSSPLPALYRALSKHLSKQQFADFFGSPFSKRGSKYTSSMRQKHLRALDRIITTKTIETKEKGGKNAVDTLLSTLYGI